MCHKGTFRLVRVLTFAATLAGLAQAQTAADWRKVGTSAVNLMLASPATGPVDRVWFSADGTRLFARTHSGKVFQTADFETWAAVAAPAEAPAPVTADAVRLPDAGAQVVAASDPGRVYALGRHLFRSDDGGRSWVNLTAYESESVVGPGQRSIAIAPGNPDELVLANDYGVWRSMDGGLSWSGLNQLLPNLGVRRILSTPHGTTGAQMESEAFGALELPPGASIWRPAPGAGIANPDAALRRRYSTALGADVTAYASAAQTVYAGAFDGRIWRSLDGGQTWESSRRDTGGPVERIFVDAAEPRVALAALGGTGAHVLRTTNSGAFWDDLTGNLPDAPAHSITADRAAGAVYAATERGVFWAHADLENASTAPVTWTSLSESLPAAPAEDVMLDPAGVQLYAALDGYGLYAAPAPHRARSLRLVSAADYTARPAAPGSLVSVIGGHVIAAQGGNLNYPVLAAADGESQIQVPFEAVAPEVALNLATGGGRVTLGLALRPVSPAIFVGRDNAPLLLDADSGMLLGPGNASHAGSRVQILATGLGKVTPEWPTGLAAPLEDPPAVAASVKAFLDRMPLQVTRATLAPGYIGFYLIEVQIPAINNAGPAELYLSADGQDSNRVSLYIEP